MNLFVIEHLQSDTFSYIEAMLDFSFTFIERKFSIMRMGKEIPVK